MKYLKVMTLEKGWCDRDELMLHATFQCLVDFMEQEIYSDNPFQPYWNADEETKHAWSEIKDLYKWWTKKRPARKDPIYRKGLKVPPIEFENMSGESQSKALISYDPKKYRGWERAIKKSAELEIKWYEEDQKNLHRLIEVRKHLWT